MVPSRGLYSASSRVSFEPSEDARSSSGAVSLHRDSSLGSVDLDDSEQYDAWLVRVAEENTTAQFQAVFASVACF
jgi:hypothetical protein